MYIYLTLIYLNQFCEMELFFFPQTYAKFKLEERGAGTNQLFQGQT